MNENNGFTPNGNGFQDPTVTPVQPDAAVSADNNASPEQLMNVQPTADAASAPVSEPVQPSAPQQPPVPTPPTYEQYAAQQAAAQQNQQQFRPQNGANVQPGGQYNPQYNPQQPYQQPPMYQNFQPNVQPVVQNNSMATASLIVGIVANVCCGFPAGIVALILGIIGLSKSKTMCGNGKGMAIAGIILGAVSIVWSIAAMVIYSVYGYAVFQTIQNDYDYSTDFYSMIRMYLPL
ncbi:MAG: DUF4190 domain-containing protein [Acutalibacteraceae bacterium]